MSIVAAVLLAQTVATAPSAEAETLGVRLAKAGSIMALLPLAAQKDTEQLVADHPELSPAEQQALRDTARHTLDAGLARIAIAFGHAYATRFSVTDLRALVAQAESPMQRRLRAAQPATMAEAMGVLGPLDFKADTMKAYCAKTGKLCPAPGAAK